MKKYVSPLTAGLTPDNWQEKINPASLSLDDSIDLLADLKAMEAFGKKVGGFVKELVRGKMPDEVEPVYTGTHFVVQVNYRSRKGGLNEELITEEMGIEWVDNHRKPPTEYEELRLKPITE